MTIVDVAWEEDLERIAEEQGLEHPDYERLQDYVSIVRRYPIVDGEQEVRDNLWKWIRDEQECFYGYHDSEEEFAEFFLDNYETEAEIPMYVVIDYTATWKKLSNTFYFSSGYVWADIY